MNQRKHCETCFVVAVLSSINQTKCTEKRQHRRALIHCISNLLDLSDLKCMTFLLKCEMWKKTILLYLLYHDIILEALRIINLSRD